MSMKTVVLAIIAASSFAVAAQAAPVKLTPAQLDHVVAGKLTTTQVNGGGQEPQGAANGVPTTTTNSGGHAPPGQNK
jgi:hypothetical protein